MFYNNSIFEESLLAAVVQEACSVIFTGSLFKTPLIRFHYLRTDEFAFKMLGLCVYDEKHI